MEPIGPILAIARLGVVVGLLFLLPGFALGPYLVPGASTPLARLGRAAGIGLLAAIAGSSLLAVLGLFRPTIVATVLAGLAILPLHADRPHWPRPSARTRRWWLAALPAAALGAGLAVMPALVLAGSDALVLAPSTWSGIPGALAIAANGGLPTDFTAWNAGAHLVPAELPSAAHLAAALQLLPGDLTTRLLVYRAALTATTILAAALLFRRWLPTWHALIAAGLFVGFAGGAQPFLGDLVDAPWLALSLFAVWLADRALVERSLHLLGTCALVAAAVLVGRVDLFLVCVTGIVAVSTARWIVAPAGGPESAGGLGHRHGRRLGLRRGLGRASLAPLAAAAVVLAVAAGAGSVGSGALSIATPVGAVLGVVDGAGGTATPVPPGWRSSGDAVADFTLALGAPTGALEDSLPVAFAGGLLATGPRGIGLGSIVVGGLLAVALGAWPWLDARRQRLAAMLVAFGLGLCLTAIAVSSTGLVAARRLAVETLLPMEWLVAAGGAGLAAGQIGRLLAARPALLVGPRRVAMLAPYAAIGLVAVAALTAAPGPTDARSAASRTAADAWAWIAAETPGDARILVNGRTDGIVAALAGRSGVLDGPADASADAGSLERATALVLGARAAFADPTSRATADFLARESVTHLLVASGSASPADVGAERLFPADLEALRSSDRFVPVTSFGGRVWLFEVLPEP